VFDRGWVCYRLEVRTSIRVKVLDVLSHVLVANKHLYEASNNVPS